MAKVVLEHLTKKFGDVTAVDDLSLEIHDGEFMVLLGPSGAGKTTTLKLISGVEHPNQGLIYIGDRLVNAIEPQKRNVAMAFESYALYPHFKVYDNLAFPLRAPGRKFTQPEVDRRVREVAEMLNITPLLDRAPAHLSGGQRQRVSLGRALVREPEILLLDEPISHLDAKLRHRMRAEFKSICAAIKTTILYVTHDYLEALSLPDRVAVIHRGKLHQIDKPEEIFERPVNLFVAGLLGQPKINQIRCTVQDSGERLIFTSTDGAIRLSTNSEIRRKVLKANLDEVILGIRPFHITVADHQKVEHGTEIEGKVYVYERLGTRGILTLSVGSWNLDTITPIGLDFNIDEHVRVIVDTSQLVVFDPTTEKNVLLD